MNKKERVDAALRGDPVDRPPVSLWGHDYHRESDVQTFTESLIEYFTRHDWDFLNVHPRASYQAEAWGVRYRASEEVNVAPILESSPISTIADWKRIRVVEPTKRALSEQLLGLQLLNHSIGYDAYVVQTIVCPLGVARSLAGQQNEFILQAMREDRKALHAALRVITESMVQFAIACLEYGAGGIFYSTGGWAKEGLLTQDQYREFGEQYDREFLDAIKSRSKINILHIGGQHIYFDLFTEYPAIHAFNWGATEEGNPNLLEGKRRSGKAVMGGVSEKSTLKKGSVSQIRQEIQQARELTQDRHFLLTAGSAVGPEVSEGSMGAVRQALR